MSSGSSKCHAQTGCTTNNGQAREGVEVLAAALSVASRYVDSLRPTNPGGGCPRTRSQEPGRGKRGQEAVDAAIVLGDAEWITLVKTWEARLHEENPSSYGCGETEEGAGQESDEERLLAAHPSDPALVERARGFIRDLGDADSQCSLMGRANAWMVKPVGQSCGRGVSATSSLVSLLQKCQEHNWKVVVQKYIERPLLIEVMRAEARSSEPRVSQRATRVFFWSALRMIGMCAPPRQSVASHG